MDSSKSKCIWSNATNFSQALMFVPGLLTKFDDTNTFLAGFKIHSAGSIMYY